MFCSFRRRWDLKGSVVHAFATFLLLSYSKLLTVSYSLLGGTELYSNKGKRVDPVVLYYNASIEYFSRQHLPFAVLAICVLLVFAVFPMLLLLLYPMRSFQRCLGYCTRIRWQFLHTFADTFQGGYKNGTNGTWDYRYFAGLYLLFRIVLLVAFIFSLNYQWLILIPLPIFVSLMFAYFRPYKNNYFNIIDGLAFVLLALTIFLIMYATRANPFPVQILYVVGLIPFLYFISFILQTPPSSSIISFLLQQDWESTPSTKWKPAPAHSERWDHWWGSSRQNCESWHVPTTSSSYKQWRGEFPNWHSTTGWCE